MNCLVCFLGLGGDAVLFFRGFFWETFSPILAAFQSSICLRFFLEFFSDRTFDWMVGVLRRGFLGPDAPFLLPKTASEKFSLS